MGEDRRAREVVEMLAPDCPECGARFAGGDPQTTGKVYEQYGSPSVPDRYRCGDCGHWFTWPVT